MVDKEKNIGAFPENFENANDGYADLEGDDVEVSSFLIQIILILI